MSSKILNNMGSSDEISNFEIKKVESEILDLQDFNSLSDDSQPDEIYAANEKLGEVFIKVDNINKNIRKSEKINEKVMDNIMPKYPKEYRSENICKNIEKVFVKTEDKVDNNFWMKKEINEELILKDEFDSDVARVSSNLKSGGRDNHKSAVVDATKDVSSFLPTRQMKMAAISVDELIVHYVRKNTCLYDRRNEFFKDTKRKKDIWGEISSCLKKMYCFEMEANAIEKRWSCLRDQFNRENRRKMSLASRSGSDSTRKWEMYDKMMFLLPHIAHRRKKTTLSSLQLNTSVQQLAVDLETSDFLSGTESPLIKSGSAILECTSPVESSERPKGTTSSCSEMPKDTTSSCSRGSSYSGGPLSPDPRKTTPEPDEFATRKRTKFDSFERELAEASQSISAAVGTMSQYIFQQNLQSSSNSRSGYMMAIEEGLRHVPDRNKTQCIIELLQVIQKYEEIT